MNKRVKFFQRVYKWWWYTLCKQHHAFNHNLWVKEQNIYIMHKMDKIEIKIRLERIVNFPAVFSFKLKNAVEYILEKVYCVKLTDRRHKWNSFSRKIKSPQIH